MQALGLTANEQEVAIPPSWTPSHYYGVDMAKLSYAELFGMSPWWTYPIIVAIKLFGFKVPPSGGISEAAPFEACKEAADAQDPSLRQMLAPVIAEAGEFNLRMSEFYGMPRPLLAGSKTIGVLLLNPSGDSMAGAIYSRSAGRSTLVTAVLSWLSDDTFLITENGPPGMKPSPRVRSFNVRGASLSNLIVEHRKRQERLRTEGITAKPILTLSQAERFQEEVERESIRWHVSRGVYVELSPEQIATAQRMATTVSDSDEPLPELSFRIDNVARSGVSGPVLGLEGRAIQVALNASAKIIWSLTVQDSQGFSAINLEVSVPSSKLVPEGNYRGHMAVAHFSRGLAFPHSMRRLLHLDSTTPMPDRNEKKLPIMLEFFGCTDQRLEPDGPPVDLSAEGAWAQFTLTFEGIEGGFHLQLNEATKEGCVGILPELDRAAAFQAFAALFVK